MPIFLSKPRLGLKAWSSRTQQSNLVSKRSLSQCKELQSRHRVLSLSLWFANLHLPGSPNMLNCSTGLNSLDDLKNNLPLSPLPCTFPSELQPSQQKPTRSKAKSPRLVQDFPGSELPSRPGQQLGEPPASLWACYAAVVLGNSG